MSTHVGKNDIFRNELFPTGLSEVHCLFHDGNLLGDGAVGIEGPVI